MANNRMAICAVDDDGNVRKQIGFAIHTGGAWYIPCNDASEFIDELNDFFEKAFFDGFGIALKDEYMKTPLPPLWHYNDSIKSEGTWIFVPASVNGKVTRYGKR